MHDSCGRSAAMLESKSNAGRDLTLHPFPARLVCGENGIFKKVKNRWQNEVHAGGWTLNNLNREKIG